MSRPPISLNNPKNLLQDPLSWFYSFWKFSRPHTIVGTSLSVIALYFIALTSTQSLIKLDNLVYLLGGVIACLCGNIYIVGLNQLEDIEIDQINKPNLPLAAREFSIKQGQIIVSITGILALGLATLLGQWLIITVGISLIIGTLYSLPPIRLKRIPLLAALCIFTVRGVIVNLGLFLYFTQALTATGFVSPSVWLLTLFILVFTVAIAIFKDVPDLEGDRQYNIKTFTLLLGKSAIFKLSCAIIIFCYLIMITAGFIPILGINPWLTIVSHLSLLFLLLWRSQGVNLEDKSSIAQFYQFIWKLFFLEYLLFPIICFLQ
ncbi:UbiA prenyltransferase [Rippkaea orientalis PCC 8801]|uniref:UbiA prenyltransferase n=1 Tax=Rippkaea orientalis (strain PCC 8801 / RF-1) TaxID=41431 RepID=B7JZF9_RIPO1|nr:homogentisate phytyltransferase [Rippkaea orientalis]ACK64119.1 UbiA prenyltransferase [Rippkaea orientalis PCC 8801]